MTKRRKIAIIALSAGLLIILAALSTAYFLLLHRYKGTNPTYSWSAEETFDVGAVATLNKRAGEDFVILNLADVQMCDLEDIPKYKTMRAEIDYLVNAVKPDLITLTGDQTWSNENLISLKTLIGWLDGYKIPYAPVFGNHDHGNEYDSAVAGINYCCDLYEGGKYSLFKRGPNNIGALGNYFVRIAEGGSTVAALYMLDSGYGEQLTDGQINYFKWAAEGFKDANGGAFVTGVCFMHKPLPEYAYAYRAYLSGDDSVTAYGDVEVHYSLYGSRQNGFFEVAKNAGVKHVVCGHQHGNAFTLIYEGVGLTFAMKTGELGGFYEDQTTYLNGATVVRINADGVTVENVTVDRNKYKLS